MTFRTALLLGAALTAIPGTAFAQETAPVDPVTQEDIEQAPQEEVAGPDSGAVEARDIVVTGRLFFRNRTDDPNPVLSYDLEYFQRFEPVSVGEMLRRVPSVTFTSDVLEYDGAQIRGLPPGFTQILINGRRVPGGENDGSFFVDRIPAELVERIELVRAPRADQPSEGVAGTINVITKDSLLFQGGFLRGGVLINEDGEARPSFGAAYAGMLGPDTSFWVAANFQQRRNPKQKESFRFGDEVPGDADETDPEFNDVEFQSDTRDGTDISGNAEIVHRFGDGGRIRLTGVIVDTDRDEDETSSTFELDGNDLELDGVEVQRERISQQTYVISGDADIPVGPGVLGLAGGWSAYREDTVAEADEGDTVAEAELVETETLDIEDDQFTGTISYTLPLGNPDGDNDLKFGIDYLRQSRDGANRVFEVDGNDIEEETGPGAIFSIRESRYDPYARLTFQLGEAVTLDLGARYEITTRRTTSDDGVAQYDDESFNPGAHLRYATGDGQFRASVARTVRRPNYDLISPYRQEETPGDEDEQIGNPLLRNEKAWGVDVGYEHRIGRNGIVGINLFYRDIEDLIELVDTGAAPENGEPGSVYRPQNIGDGQTWGVEIDLSAPLTFLGLPDTGIFANYTYLDSETTDPFTGEDRRFNNQPHHVYSAGFIQNLRSLNVSFGANISGRSESVESNFDETVALEYDPDLEAFIEWRFARGFVLRGAIQNILDREKRETFRVFDGDSFEEILENRNAGDLDEFELERERSGPLFQVTLRAAF